MASTAQGRRVLVVEGVASIALAVRVALSREGYECVVAGSQDDALRHLREGPFDLVIVDVGPADDAADAFLGAIQTLQPAARLVALTRYADGSLRARSLSTPPHGVLTRPFTLDELFRTVTDALRRFQR